MDYYNKIKQIVNNVEVEAETVFAHPSEFSLRLINPEFDVCFHSIHILYMALGFRRYFERDGQISEYGLETANPMIEGLYKGYLFVNQHLKELDECLRKVAKQLNPIELELDENILKLNSIKSDWKVKFKSKRIGEIEYIKNRKEIESKKNELLEIFAETKQTLINARLAEIYPSFSLSEDKLSDYTAESAVNIHFWNLLNELYD